MGTATGFNHCPTFVRAFASVAIECVVFKLSLQRPLSRRQVMQGFDGHDLDALQDMRIWRVGRNSFELSEFRQRSGSGITSECHGCHKRGRAAQQIATRHRKRQKNLQVAFAETNAASRPSVFGMYFLLASSLKTRNHHDENDHARCGLPGNDTVHVIVSEKSQKVESEINSYSFSSFSMAFSAVSRWADKAPLLDRTAR